MKNFAFVVGSVHLDILAVATEDDSTLDKIGQVSMEIGGTAFNVAANLVKLGQKCRFMTAMNTSPYSRIIREYLQELGIQLIVDINKELPTAAFSAHINKEGGLISAVSATPVSVHGFNEAKVIEAMRGAWCVILDCNLSETSLNMITRVANGMMIPVFVAAVSEEKSLRIAGINGIIDAAFMNEREAKYLRAKRFGDATTYRQLASLVKTNLVVTKGKSGAVVASPEKMIDIPPPKAGSSIQGNTLGAGDAMMAAIVHEHIFMGKRLIEAAISSRKTIQIMLDKKNCHLGDDRAVEKILEGIHTTANTDTLTRLPNRKAVEKFLSDQVSLGNTQSAILLLDVDFFKSINDEYGHDMGDEILIKISRSIEGSIRDGDLAGRWGGEEFICVLPNADEELAWIVAERVRRHIESSITTPRQVTISAGAAIMEPGEKMRDLVKRADVALYDAKKQGRNRVCLNRNQQSLAA